MILETKFNIGEEFWFMKDNKPIMKTVEKVVAETHKNGIGEYEWDIMYAFWQMSKNPNNSDWEYISEKDCFPTKIELIESL